MPSVWYIGPWLERTISTAEWSDAGITGVAAVSWNRINGFSISEAEFSVGQLNHLASHPDFLTNQADGPRQANYTNPGSYQVPNYLDVVSKELTNIGDIHAIDVSKLATLVVHNKGGSGGCSAINMAFEGSLDSTDGTDGTWFNLQAGRTDTNTVATTSASQTLAADTGQTYAHEISVNGVKWFRSRITARTSGSLINTIMPSLFATESVPAIQSHAVTNTPSSTAYQYVTTASTNLVAARNAACYLWEIALSNPTATQVFVKFYNKSSAPVLASDIPALTIPVPAGQTILHNFGQNGKRFTSGWAFAVTAGMAANDTAAAVAGVQIHGCYT